MKFRRISIAIITTAILVGFALVEAQIAWDPEKFMPLEEIKPSMQGKCYTVFSGTTVEPFDFEVISIEYNYTPTWHVIWIKGLSENFKQTGGAGGMSGSPCYIDGRLIGAFSLAFWNQREHANIGGVTPIQMMVEVTHRGMTPNPDYAGNNLFNLRKKFTVQDIDFLPFGEIPEKPPNQFDTLRLSTTTSKSAVIQTPLALSTTNTQIMEVLKPVFQKHGMTPIQGSGGGAPVKSTPIAPGQIVGIEYARGDFAAFGYGTITHIEGKQMLAFGHAMSGEGNVNLPLSGGYVHFILPLNTRSSKYASATGPIGTLVQDREGAIAGLIGDYPKFLPINAKVQTTDGKIHKKKYEVARDPDMASMMAMIGVWNIIDSIEMYRGDHQINIDTTIKLAGQQGLNTQEINHSNIFSSSGSPGIAAYRSISPLIDLMDNPYNKVIVDKVDINIKIEDKRKTAIIEGLRIEKDSYRPGELISISVILRPYLENPIVQKAQITIPQDTPEALVTLLVSSGASYENWQRQRAPLNYQPKNINQLVKLLQRGENNSDLIVELFIPKFGMTVQGEEFPEPTVSMLSVMNSQTQSGEGGYTRGRTLHTEKTSTDYVLAGSRFLRIMINRSVQ